MKTVNIKGKEYVEVNERVKHFRNSEDYKGWRIQTRMLGNDNGVCVFKAEIVDNCGAVIASGHAYEREDSTYINKTSYIENCETSAVGRALGFLGIGIDTSIASGDEVRNAVKNQESEKSDSTHLSFDELRKKYSKMTVDELRKEYVAVKTYKGWSDKQKEAVCGIIKKIQGDREQ